MDCAHDRPVLPGDVREGVLAQANATRLVTALDSGSNPRFPGRRRPPRRLGPRQGVARPRRDVHGRGPPPARFHRLLPGVRVCSDLVRERESFSIVDADRRENCDVRWRANGAEVHPRTTGLWRALSSVTRTTSPAATSCMRWARAASPCRPTAVPASYRVRAPSHGVSGVRACSLNSLCEGGRC